MGSREDAVDARASALGRPWGRDTAWSAPPEDVVTSAAPWARFRHRADAETVLDAATRDGPVVSREEHEEICAAARELLDALAPVRINNETQAARVHDLTQRLRELVGDI